MSSEKIRKARLAKEIRLLNEHAGFSCEQKDEYLEVKFTGPMETLYENQDFYIKVKFDDRYPFSPPQLQLLTPVYHPNIDKDGKICLNILNMPPDGEYNPAMTLESILVSVQLLIGLPNPYDPIRSDAASDFILNKQLFEDKTRKLIDENKKAGQSTTQKQNHSK